MNLLIAVYLFAESKKYPWGWAKVTVHTHYVSLTLTDGQNLRFNSETYEETFGTLNGNQLFIEFESALAVEEAPSRNMTAYIGIWRVFGDEWTKYIASLKRKRNEVPPPSEGLLSECTMYSICFESVLNMQGQCIF